MNSTNLLFSYDVVIAHGPGCNDGATAAWSVWRLLPFWYQKQLAAEGGFYAKPNQDEESEESNSGDSYVHPNSPEGAIKLQNKGFSVVFVFIQPSEGVPDVLVKNKRVLILDLDMGDALISLVRAATYTLLSDHHDSTPNTLCKYSQILFDENRHKFATYVNTNLQESGATLAWRLTHSAVIPPFVQVIRIGDTWQWDEYPELHAKAVLTALYMKRAMRSFSEIEETFQTWDKYFPEYVQKGKTALEYERSITRQMAKQCDLGFIQTHDGIVYNVAYTQASALHSEVGSSIRYYAEKRFKVPIHFCCTWKYASFKKLVSVSLRDSMEGLNLARIARTVKGSNGKGGGHVAAAGFSFYGIENFHKFILISAPVASRLHFVEEPEDPEESIKHVTQQNFNEFPRVSQNNGTTIEPLSNTSLVIKFGPTLQGSATGPGNE
ncbi:Hypothetical protein HVR_LOCUS1060 [uncultured virus]|nr:Hypothetical protein HVR_LOCUS1060 [uncultured virus]